MKMCIKDKYVSMMTLKVTNISHSNHRKPKTESTFDKLEIRFVTFLV